MRSAPTIARFAWFDKYLKPQPVPHTLLISDHGPERRNCGDRVAIGQGALEGA